MADEPLIKLDPEKAARLQSKLQEFLDEVHGPLKAEIDVLQFQAATRLRNLEAIQQALQDAGFWDSKADDYVKDIARLSASRMQALEALQAANKRVYELEQQLVTPTAPKKVKRRWELVDDSPQVMRWECRDSCDNGVMLVVWRNARRAWVWELWSGTVDDEPMLSGMSVYDSDAKRDAENEYEKMTAALKKD